MMEKLLGALASCASSNGGSACRSFVAPSNGMKGASCDAEAKCDGRKIVEEANVWRKCGGYGEVGGESLKSLGQPSRERVPSF